MFDDMLIPKRLWPIFKPQLHRLATAAMPYAMVSKNRMQNLYRLWRRVERDGIAGDFVEAGIARGGSALLITLAAMEGGGDRQMWLYDAFGLLDDPVADADEVRRTFYETFALDRERVHIIEALFEDAVPKHPDRPIAFLHIDTGSYEGTHVCFEQLFDKLTPGGWLVLDNYGSVAGCRRATDEQLAKRGLTGGLSRLGKSQAFMRKG